MGEPQATVPAKPASSFGGGFKMGEQNSTSSFGGGFKMGE